jgi:hypothetical protein
MVLVPNHEGNVMKILITALALASLVATSAVAKTETSATVRAEKVRLMDFARQPSQHVALFLGVAY